MSERICKSCKHYGQGGRCEHRYNLDIDIVDGSKEHKQSCSTLRNKRNFWGFYKFCGKSGKWFESKFNNIP